jgi:TonB family protein
MHAPALRSIALAASLLGALPGGLVFPLFLHAATTSNKEQAPSLGNRAVSFDFAGLDESGGIQLGKPLKLSLTLNGVAQGRTPMVAVCESPHFEPYIVTMEPDPLSKGLRATAILEPIAPGTLSVIPTFARIRVTFARAITDKKLDRVMTRIVYVTLDKHDTEHNAVEFSSSGEDHPVGEDVRDEDIPPDAIPIADASLAEEDLLPLPEPGLGQVYWQQVSSLLSRSWSRTARHVRHAPSSETVRVRFRMYPNGRAQLIEIEKGSGAKEIDEAGIHAVIHAQPFPPFPEDIGSEPVDVHVRMRTGGRRGARDIQRVSDFHTPRQSAPALIPKP